MPTPSAPLHRDDALLRVVLRLDAMITGANGIAYLAAARPLGDLLGPSPELLRALGALLVAFAAVVAIIAFRPALPRIGARAVVAANLVWVAASITVGPSDWVDPTAAGVVWLVLQALAVSALAGAQGLLVRDARTEQPLVGSEVKT